MTKHPHLKNRWLRLAYWIILILIINNINNMDDQNHRNIKKNNKIESLVEMALLLINDSNELQDFKEGTEETKTVHIPLYYTDSFPFELTTILPTIKELNFPMIVECYTHPTIQPQSPPPWQTV